MKELPLLPVIQPGAGAACCSGDDCCSSSDAAASTTVEDVPAEARRLVFGIDGMDCASCAMTLERTVRAVPGVHHATVNFAAARLDVRHAADVTSTDVERAVERAGFRVAEAGGAGGPSFWSTTRGRITIAAAGVYVIGLALVVAPNVAPPASIAAFVVAIALAGMPIFRAAWIGLRARHLDMNVLMSAATVGASILGEWAEAASIVVLFGVGNALQAHAVARTRDAVRALVRLAPDEVLLLDGEEQRLVATSEVGIGDRFAVRPGERIAIDGIVEDGQSSVDESSVTGESLPVARSVGDVVRSGSLNADGGLVVRATRRVEDSTLQHVVRLVEQAQATRAPTEQLVDRFSRVYTPVVVLAAVLLAVGPVLFGQDAGTWAYRALALLIIACPCSLVISTPVTVVSAIGAASRRGLLIKGGEALEATGRLRALAFDKTGTLTEGRPVVTSIDVVADVDRDWAIARAAAVEGRSEHPLAHAILTAAEQLAVPTPTSFTAIPGRGASAQVDGVTYLVGSPRLLAEHGIPTAVVAAWIDAAHAAGATPVILADEHAPLAVFALADAIRDDAPEAIAQLRASGIEHLVMLTGDSEPAARRVAEQLGLEYRAELLPEEKLAAIEQLRTAHGSVGMVGDGINDAPALAAATVSFAMGAAGSDVALESADVALMHDDLLHVARAIALSRAAERTIRQNVVVSLVVKGAFVLAAPFGVVALWAAVLADMGTSLAVTGNGLRLFHHRSVR